MIMKNDLGDPMKTTSGSAPAGGWTPYASTDAILEAQPETSSAMPDYDSPLLKALREKEIERG